jgi:hypothetical protein
MGIGTITLNNKVTISFNLYGSLTGEGRVIFANLFLSVNNYYYYFKLSNNCKQDVQILNMLLSVL